MLLSSSAWVKQCCPQAAQQAKLTCHPHTGAAEMLGQPLPSCPPTPYPFPVLCTTPKIPSTLL